MSLYILDNLEKRCDADKKFHDLMLSYIMWYTAELATNKYVSNVCITGIKRCTQTDPNRHLHSPLNFLASFVTMGEF